MYTYDRLGATKSHRWWTPLLSTVVAALFMATLVCIVYAGSALVSSLIGRPEDPALGHSFGALFDNLLMVAVIAMFTPVVMVVVQLIQRRPARTLHSVTGRLRWRWLGLCCLAAVPGVVGLMIAVHVMYGEPGDELVTVQPARLLMLTLLIVLLVPLQAAGEEYVCRGFLLQTFGAYSRWAGIAVSALAFALLHGLESWWGFAALMVNGVVWAALVIRTGGLEAPIAAHAVNNVVAFWVGAAVGELDTVDDSSVAGAPWQLALLIAGVDIVFVVLVLVLLWAINRWRPGWVPESRARIRSDDEPSLPEGQPGHHDGQIDAGGHGPTVSLR